MPPQDIFEAEHLLVILTLFFNFLKVVCYHHVFMSVEGLVAGGGGPDTSHRVVAGGGRLGGRRG